MGLCHLLISSDYPKENPNFKGQIQPRKPSNDSSRKRLIESWRYIWKNSCVSWPATHTNSIQRSSVTQWVFTGAQKPQMDQVSLSWLEGCVPLSLFWVNCKAAQTLSGWPAIACLKSSLPHRPVLLHFGIFQTFFHLQSLSCWVPKPC